MNTISKQHRFYRLGTTSFIIPADILPNVAYLAPRVDDIELLLFESEDLSNLPDKQTVNELIRHQQQWDLTYTVHLPLDIELGSAVERRRRSSVDQCCRIFDMAADLHPFGYIVHFNAGANRDVPQEDKARWQNALSDSVQSLLKTGVDPTLLCVETLAYPYEWVFDIVRAHGLSVCLDVGHLLLDNRSVPSHFDLYFENCRVIHLHGVDGRKDHVDLSHFPPELLAFILTRLNSDKKRERVLTLEIFNETDFEKSLAALSSLDVCCSKDSV